MLGIDGASLLDVWESGAGSSNPARAHALLARAGAWSDGFGLGERDARLLELRRRTFGEELRAFVACPECGQKLEIVSSVSDVTFEPCEPDVRGGRAFSATIDGYEVSGRTPTVADVSAAARCADVASARAELVRRCVTDATDGAGAVPAEDLPAGVLEAVGEVIADADPQAEIRLRLACAACGHGWRASLDIAQFLWSEVAAAGRRVLDEVVTLAAAYGWSEAEILSLSPWRRRTYVDGVAGG